MIVLTLPDEDAATLLNILAETMFPLVSDEADVARDLFCTIKDALEGEGGDPKFLL
jgi:hypothetical protein